MSFAVSPVEMIEVIHDPSTQWWPGEVDAAHFGAADVSLYFVPQSLEEVTELRKWVYELSNGSCIAVRGRDRSLPVNWPGPQQADAVDLAEAIVKHRASITDLFTNWELGVALKSNNNLFLMWPAIVECYPIGTIDFLSLLHFRKTPKLPLDRMHICDAKTVSSHVPGLHQATDKVIVLCHGFSPDVGPKYAFIQVLQAWLTALGWTVVVPNFTASYAYGPARGRSERVRIVLEELLIITSQTHAHHRAPVVLIGHSQGGAAVAQACASEKV